MEIGELLFDGLGQGAFFEDRYTLPSELFRDDLLLKTEYTLISPGTEMDCLMGRAGGKTFPKCLGYSAVCRVERCGAEVSEFQIGDRVLVYHSIHQSFQLKNKADVVKVPDGLDPVDAVFAVVGCMGFQGVRKVKPELGEGFLIMGLGLLGQIAAQCASLNGAFPLIATDYNEHRRKIALEHGVDFAFSPDEPELFSKVKELTHGGMGVNCAVEITGNPSAVKQTLKMMAPFGRVALVGCSRTPTTEIDFYNDVHRPGIQLIGAHNFVRPKEDSYPGYWTMKKDMALLMDLIKARRLNTHCLVTTVEKPQNAPSVYARFMKKDPIMLGAVFDWRSI